MNQMPALRLLQVPTPSSEAAPDDGWRASIALAFRGRDGRTRLQRRGGYGPLYIQKPFYPEGEVCHLYLLHPPGGVVGGDRLEVEVEVADGARALITTPAAGKFYRSAGQQAFLNQRLSVDDGAALEWLPQETLLFNGAEAVLETRVVLSPGARFIGWEMVVFGRTASQERFDHGNIAQRIGLYRQSAGGIQPLLLEHARWRGGERAMSAPWGLAGYCVSATLFATPADEDLRDLVRGSLSTAPPEINTAREPLIAATLVNGVLVVRVLADDTEIATALLRHVWATLRPPLMGRNACPPRIWNT